MIDYLSTKQIASKLGVSHNIAKKWIRNAKPPERKDSEGNYTFEWGAIVDFLRKQA